MTSACPTASVVLCTYNRARWLDATLASLRAMPCESAWDIIVVDNNSTDDTADVIAKHASAAEIPIRAIFEPRQGKSNALNTALAHVRSDVIAFTDDDVVVDAGWLDEACRVLAAHPDAEYVGGPVRPLWECAPPPWFDRKRGHLWGTVAILDYGTEPFVFEERQRVPLGVNMAVRRRLIDRIGGFHPDLGRTGRSLLGQEQGEFFARARGTGAYGIYAPGMRISHHVPAARLTKRYFLRWWFWKGVSRARVDAMHGRTELGLDLRSVPRLAGVPRFVWGQIPRAAGRWAAASLRGRTHDAMRHAMYVSYALGYIRQCWKPQVVAPVRAPHPPGAMARSIGTGVP